MRRYAVCVNRKKKDKETTVQNKTRIWKLCQPAQQVDSFKCPSSQVYIVVTDIRLVFFSCGRQVHIDPSDAAITFELAVVLHRQGRNEAARDLYEKVGANEFTSWMSRIHKKKINNIVSIYHTIKTNQFPGKSINSLKIATLPEGGGFRFIDNPTTYKYFIIFGY